MEIGLSQALVKRNGWGDRSELLTWLPIGCDVPKRLVEFEGKGFDHLLELS